MDYITYFFNSLTYSFPTSSLPCFAFSTECLDYYEYYLKGIQKSKSNFDLKGLVYDEKNLLLNIGYQRYKC